MKCYFCGGQTEPALVTDLHSEGSLYLAVENVPADVCQQCGERYYTPEVTKRLLALTDRLREHAAVGVPGQRTEFTVCDLAASESPQ